MKRMNSLRRMAIAVALALLAFASTVTRLARDPAPPVAVASAEDWTCRPSDAGEGRLPAGGGHERGCGSCLPCGVGVAFIDTPSVPGLVVPHATQIAWTVGGSSLARRPSAYARLARGPPSLS